jgi:hypothetical protein
MGASKICILVENKNANYYILDFKLYNKEID